MGKTWKKAVAINFKTNIPTHTWMTWRNLQKSVTLSGLPIEIWTMYLQNSNHHYTEMLDVFLCV
jgi:hypothetical protein